MRAFLFTLSAILFFQCQDKNDNAVLNPHQEFLSEVLEKNDSFYGVTGKRNKQLNKQFAIGMFDSGIGGLTVFDAVVNADYFDSSNEDKPDGIKDFNREQFIYFADQANMPYSNYVEEGSLELLQEHILKDFLFLVNNKYHRSPQSTLVLKDNPEIKAVVVACNTATAYGMPQIEELSKLVSFNGRIIGVIDAGCKGALELVGENRNITVAVFATPATVSSKAYVHTLTRMMHQHSGSIDVVQQGGKGLHESIDNIPDFINKQTTKPYANYMGPGLQNRDYELDKALLANYNFDTTNHNVLYNKESIHSSDTIQINSVENYTRYHLVSLMEQIKSQENTKPLNAIILGCTHYPYASEYINKIIEEFRYTGLYSGLLEDTVFLVDPAVNTARELYEYLVKEDLLNDNGPNSLEDSKFFISVPNMYEPKVETDTEGRFTYEYQYKKRKSNDLASHTLIVPMSRETVSDEQMKLIAKRLPFSYELIQKNFVENQHGNDDKTNNCDCEDL